MSRMGREVSPLVFSKSSWNLRFRTSFLDFSASMDAANFFSRSTSWPFLAPMASSTEANLRGTFGASWSMTAFSFESSFSRAPQQGQRTSKSMDQVYRRQSTGDREKGLTTLFSGGAPFFPDGRGGLPSGRGRGDGRAFGLPRPPAGRAESRPHTEAGPGPSGSSGRRAPGRRPRGEPLPSA